MSLSQTSSHKILVFFGIRGGVVWGLDGEERHTQDFVSFSAETRTSGYVTVRRSGHDCLLKLNFTPKLTKLHQLAVVQVRDKTPAGSTGVNIRIRDLKTSRY